MTLFKCGVPSDVAQLSLTTSLTESRLAVKWKKTYACNPWFRRSQIAIAFVARNSLQGEVFELKCKHSGPLNALHILLCITEINILSLTHV
jgi:hypothetical protein